MKLFTVEKTAALVGELTQKIVASGVIDSVPEVYRSYAADYFLVGKYASYRLERFLIKQKGRVDGALKEIKKCIEMRTAKDLWMCVIDDEDEVRRVCGDDAVVDSVQAALKTGVFYLQGEDLMRRPNIVCKLRNIPKDVDVASVGRAVVFVMDALERRLDARREAAEQTGARVGEGQEFDAKWNMIMDCGDLQISSAMGRKIGMELVTTLLLFYSERGNKTFLIDPDWCVWAVLKLIQPFLDEEQRGKIVQFTRSRDFVAKGKNVPELARICDPRWIDVEYGGSYTGAFCGEQYWNATHRRPKRATARATARRTTRATVRCSQLSARRTSMMPRCSLICC